MPIASYSVLRGQPTAGKVVTGRSTHYQITLQGTGGPFTVAVNVQSSDGSEVLYAIHKNFIPPNPAGLIALASGMHGLPSTPGGLALDFVREQIGGKPMITLAQMTLLPTRIALTTHANPLLNAVDTLLNQAVAANSTIFAFGSAFADSGRVDGIHNIHMNQGNPGSFAHDNGTGRTAPSSSTTPRTRPGPPSSSPSRPNPGPPTTPATRSPPTPAAANTTTSKADCFYDTAKLSEPKEPARRQLASGHFFRKTPPVNCRP